MFIFIVSDSDNEPLIRYLGLVSNAKRERIANKVEKSALKLVRWSKKHTQNRTSSMLIGRWKSSFVLLRKVIHIQQLFFTYEFVYSSSPT